MAEYAHVVEDTADRRVPVHVAYARPVTPAERRVLDGLGVTPRRRFPGLPPVVDAWWPESVVTRVARLPAVAYVRARPVGCGAGASAGGSAGLPNVALQLTRTRGEGSAAAGLLARGTPRALATRC